MAIVNVLEMGFDLVPGRVKMSKPLYEPGEELALTKQGVHHTAAEALLLPH